MHSKVFSLFILVSLLASCIPPSKKEMTVVDIDLEQSHVRSAFDMQNADLTDSLYNLFTSEDPTLRYLATNANASLKSKMSIDKVAEMLNDPILKVRASAAYALGQYKENAVARYLIGAFKNEDTLSVNTLLNHNILEAIGKCGDEELLRLISSTDTYRTTDTLLLLGQARGIYRYTLRDLTHENGTAKMVEMVTTPQIAEEVRLVAAHYLARSKELDISNYQFQIADVIRQERSVNIRMALAQGLKHSTDPDILTFLLDQIDSERDYRVKINLMKSTFKFPYGQVVDKMISLLSDKNLHVAATAAEYLIENGKKEDAPYYRQLAEEENVHWLIKTKLYEAVFNSLPPYYVNTISSLRRKIVKEINDTKSKTEKIAYIRVLSKDINAYNSLLNLFKESEDQVIKSTIAESIATIYSDPSFPLYQNRLGPIARARIKKEVEELTADGDVGVLYHLSSAISNEENNLALLFEDVSFLTKAQDSLVLPKDVETYNSLNDAIKACKPDTTILKYVPPVNSQIDWQFLQKYPDSTLAIIKTDKGLIKVALNYEAAPMSVYNFLKLSEENFYDNKTFHRVASNFVIQGGCPRGDGFGSANHTIRSEFSQVYYDDEGYLGMASAGPHTESVQWFITHSPAPHLDGRYTIFGKVISGMDVVHAILPGDKIEDIILTSVL